MASTYSNRLRLELITNGEQDALWGTTTNKNLGTLIEEAIAGVSSISMSSDANVTLTASNGASDEARPPILQITSGVSLTATRDIIVPDGSKFYLVYNNTTGGQSIRVKTSAGTGITIPNGKRQWVYCDGTNVVDAINNLPSGTTIGGGTVYSAGGTDVALADGGTGTSLSDPGADGLMGWDDSAGNVIFFTLAGSGISFDGTTVKLSANLEEWSTINPSANGASLVSAADYAAMRGLLDLEPGTDFLSPAAIAAAYQPLDAQLTAFAANTGVTGTITVSTSDPSGGSDGDIHLKYTA
jgi:hypothetical protein